MSHTSAELYAVFKHIQFKFIYLCKKYANQTTSAGGQKWISSTQFFTRYASKRYLNN